MTLSYSYDECLIITRLDHDRLIIDMNDCCDMITLIAYVICFHFIILIKYVNFFSDKKILMAISTMKFAYQTKLLLSKYYIIFLSVLQYSVPQYRGKKFRKFFTIDIFCLLVIVFIHVCQNKRY